MTLKLDVYAIARHYLEDHAHAIESSTMNDLLGKIRARDYRALASVTGPLDTQSISIDQYRVMRQVEAFFKKNDEFADDEYCTDAAMTSFNRGERICRITNKRLDHYYTKKERLPADLDLWCRRASSFIQRALGDYTDFMGALPGLLKVSSGATARTPRSRSLPFQKLDRQVACSPQCEPYLKAAFRFYGYKGPRVQTTAWNRVTYVPKSWKTHRTIACEPAGNVPFQLAFDVWAKRRLRRYGIDLSDQEKNQRLAKSGSIDGNLATIDLAMASDTLAYNTVQWLLPPEWCDYLNATRSPLYRLPEGEDEYRYAKFSSMGNGATFALETLIFASFVYAVGGMKGSDYAVYGDDIIICAEKVPDLYRLLRFFGFVPNVEKSFTKGPFRESCGADYFNGIDITPFYVRSTREWDKPYACHNVNGLARVATDGAVWRYLARFITEAKLPYSAVSYDTQSGVHLHPYHAYGQKNLIRVNRDGHLQYLAYTRKGGKQTCKDSRGLGLWFLSKQNTQELTARDLVQSAMSLHSDVDDYISTFIRSSRYTTSTGKYAEKWRSWTFNPTHGRSERLFRFSDYLTAIPDKHTGTAVA